MNARLTLMVVWLSLTMASLAHPPPPAKATVDDAAYGTNNSKYMTPSLVATAVGSGTVVSNFSQNLTFNGKVTFNSNVVVTTLSFPTNAWPGATNTLLLNTNYLNYVATTDCAITNVGGQDATMNTWATLTVSNSTASDITVRTYSPGIRLQGASTTAALVVGAGKEGYLSFHCRGVLSTNLVTSTQQ